VTWLHHLGEWVDVDVLFYAVVFDDVPWLYDLGFKDGIDMWLTRVLAHEEFVIADGVFRIGIDVIFILLRHPKPIGLVIDPQFTPKLIPLEMVFSKPTLFLIEIGDSGFLFGCILNIE
jgi:hypothetical protein